MRMKCGEHIKITKVDTSLMMPISEKKLSMKRNYYYQNGYFRDEIILNKKNQLINGYSTYLLAQEFGIKNIVFKRKGGKFFKKYLKNKKNRI